MAKKSIFIDKNTNDSIFGVSKAIHSYMFTSQHADDLTGVTGFKLGDTHIGAVNRVAQWRNVPLYSDAKLQWSKPNVFTMTMIIL